MAYTLEQVQTVLVRRVGGLMTACDMDGTTVASLNSDLNDPLGYALRAVGLSIGDIMAIDDDDFSGLSSDKIDEFLDLAEYRALQSCIQNYTAVNVSIGSRSESFGQLADRIEKRIQDLMDKLKAEYGVGLGTLEAGHISLSFAEHDEVDIIEE